MTIAGFSAGTLRAHQIGGVGRALSSLYSRCLLAALICAVLPTITIGCGGGSDGPGDVTSPIVASFAPSGTAASPDLVRLTATTSGDVVLVNVVLAGPTTSSDLYSLAFDLALSDPDVAHYVAGSATLGPALSLGAGQQGQALASQSQHRVTVGITKLGGGSGNGIGPTEEVLASFRFRVRKRGSTTIWLAGSSPDPPSALDSTGAKIDSVTFDAARASISGS